MKHQQCDNCGRRVDPEQLYSVGHWQGRVQYVCGNCLERVAGAVAQVNQLFRRAA